MTKATSKTADQAFTSPLSPSESGAHVPLRRTKIVATLGPASDRPGVLEAMLKAGVDVVRLNFSHGSADDHRRRLNDVREIAARLGRSVAALGDLQGP